MAYLVDKETKKFWKKFGEGLTSDIAQAADLPISAAHALMRIFWKEVYISDLAEGTEHHWEPDTTDRSPLLTQAMKDKNLVWVGYNGYWMATDRQALVFGTLLAYNAPSPFDEPVAA